MEKTIAVTGLESRETCQKVGAGIAIFEAQESPERWHVNCKEEAMQTEETTTTKSHWDTLHELERFLPELLNMTSSEIFRISALLTWMRDLQDARDERFNDVMNSLSALYHYTGINERTNYLRDKAAVKAEGLPEGATHRQLSQRLFYDKAWDDDYLGVKD